MNAKNKVSPSKKKNIRGQKKKKGKKGRKNKRDLNNQLKYL